MPIWEISDGKHVNHHEADEPPFETRIFSSANRVPTGTRVIVEASGGQSVWRRPTYILITEKQPHRTLGTSEDLELLRILAEKLRFVIVESNAHAIH